jgi:hypothetical protein
MLLNEFFGHLHIKNSSNTSKDQDTKLKEEGLLADLLEFILNDDALHKNVFFPIAEEIGRRPTEEHTPEAWMPLANKGCMKFYHKFDLKENPKELFSKKLREELCTRLSEHYNSDILKGVYNLGK